jgi:hypothetical protein
MHIFPTENDQLRVSGLWDNLHDDRRPIRVITRQDGMTLHDARRTVPLNDVPSQYL